MAKFKVGDRLKFKPYEELCQISIFNSIDMAYLSDLPFTVREVKESDNSYLAHYLSEEGSEFQRYDGNPYNPYWYISSDMLEPIDDELCVETDEAFQYLLSI